MPSEQPQEATQQELRLDLIKQTNEANITVREKVSQLNDREKEYMHTNSVEYRQLVDTIRAYSSR